jgi:hypothetical protein
MGELWSGLARTLSRLDRLAGDPHQLDAAEAVDALRRLQYALHTSAERAFGVVPPVGAETAHAELADALACARDATAEVAEACAVWGAEGVQPLLHEWRGALFRVRLARMRLVPPPRRRAADEAPAALTRPLIAFLLALGGSLTFVAGATLALWPLWTAGLLAVCGSVVAYRP